MRFFIVKWLFSLPTFHKDAMKNLSLFAIILNFTLSLLGCSHQEYYQAQISQNYTREAWMQQINLNPNLWTAQADPWYFVVDKDPITHQTIFDPVAQAMVIKPSHMANFTQIKINGNYRIQIIGHQREPSIGFSGTAAAKRQVAIEIHDQTLFIHPKPECEQKTNFNKECLSESDKLIIRIGINNLRRLSSYGNNTVTGKDVVSNGLIIEAGNRSRVLLRGNMRLTEANASGCASIIVLGAFTPCVNINVNGCGTINVAGRVGIRSISNVGNGQVNIVGADSSMLTIYSKDASLTQVAGLVSLRKVTANDRSRVYLYSVRSGSLDVKVYDHACVGLAGCVNNLNVETHGSSGFLGKDLHASNLYVRTFDSSHANVSATQKIFASAADNSGIYYFGSPANISRFLTENGTIVPIWTTPLAVPVEPRGTLSTFNYQSEA